VPRPRPRPDRRLLRERHRQALHATNLLLHEVVSHPISARYAWHPDTVGNTDAPAAAAVNYVLVGDLD
jgi:hypothetical protein